MASNQAYIHGTYSMLKLIADHDSVRVKLCPRHEDGHVDEVDKAVAISLDRQGVNMLIRDLRKMRDRCFGRDE